MGSVNIDAIMAKVEKWKESPAGKKRIAQAQKAALAASVADMQAAVEQLKQMIVEAASSEGVAESVIAHLASASISGPKEVGDGVYEFSISFGGSLSRPSLEPNKYGGISNIVALFDNGYDAPRAKYVGGYWHGKYTWGKTHRDSLGFVGSAVGSWNASVGARYNGVATPSGEYQ